MNERAEELLKENPFLNNMELAYRLIFEDILDGKFDDEEQLQQDSLGGLYGMSRTPIREALIKLEGEGYIEKGKRGYKMGKLDVVDYIDFWEFRRTIETYVAYLAAENASSVHLKKLKKNLEKTKQVGESGNTKDVFRCDEEFHKLVVQASRNKYFIDIYNLYESKIRYYRYLYQQHVTADIIYDAHLKIYKALEKRNEEAARSAMYQHLNAFREHLRKRLE